MQSRNTIQQERFDCRTKQLREQIGNVYITHDLDDWPKNPCNNFKLKYWLFVATNIRQIMMEQVHGVLVIVLLLF